MSVQQIKLRYRYSAILLRELVRTDFKVRYQYSLLGYTWSLLRPLFIFIVLYLVFVKFLGIGKAVPHWPVLLFLGLVMWEFFTEVTNQGLRAVVGKGDLIRKINFPKYVIILSSSISALINLALNLIVVAIFIVLTRTPAGWGYSWVLVYIVELYLFSLGLAFLLSAIYIKLRDTNFIWEIILRAGMYASAVMFPMSRIFNVSHFAGQLFLLNPVTQVIQDSRHGIVSSMPTSYSLLGGWMSIIPFVIVLLFLVFGAWYFRRHAPYFAEEV